MDDAALYTLNALVILGLWWLYFIEYRRYRLDKTRQDLFAIRNDLFDKWAAMGMPFDDGAYGMVRTTLNGMIQFAHRISIIRLAAAIAADQQYRSGETARQYEENLSNRLNKLPPNARKAIQDAREQMHYVIASHLIFSSLVFSTLAIIAAVFLMTTKLRKWLAANWSAVIDAEAETIGTGHSHNGGHDGRATA